MEEGTKAKRTIFIGGIGDDVDEDVLLQTFNTFGDVVEVQIPPAHIPANPNAQYQSLPPPDQPKHRGFGFVTYTSAGDAQDAIDNMDLNELRGRVLRVNLAKPQLVPTAGLGNRAIWENEEWLKQYAKPLAQSGGVGARAAAREQDRKDDPDIDDNATVQE